MNFDLSLNIATINGSGSQSANLILTRSLFRSGLSISSKNVFPSNISGLPTWFAIRIKNQGTAALKTHYDIIVAMNDKTWEQDARQLSKNGIFIYNSDLKINPEIAQRTIGIPFKKLAKDSTDSVKLVKLLTNMVYVGALAELIGIDKEILSQSVRDQFKSKPSLIEINERSLDRGKYFIKSEKIEIPIQLPPPNKKNKEKILIDGNTAGALGMVNGGCHFLSWYPITPSTSLAENFKTYANRYRKDKSGKNTFAVVQAEDELSAISMVLGAGWSGIRAATATSGPGLSLMSEAAGLSYFAEIPAVIWGVQRVGPSTGLPTRTMQGDLNIAYNMSHGDGQHIVLLPGTPQDCYDFGQIAFDLAEQFQTLVIVLSDLDLGMNLWISAPLQPVNQEIQRGKVLKEEQLRQLNEFARYKDVDGDAIPYRTLPGTLDDRAAYFTRGSGHNENAKYSENPEEYSNLLNRLKRKFHTAKQFVPKPVIDWKDGVRRGIIAFGSTWAAIEEVRENQDDINFMRLRALPLTKECEQFIAKHDELYVIEQNRDGQLLKILVNNFPQHHNKLKSIRDYSGWPFQAQTIYEQGPFNEY